MKVVIITGLMASGKTTIADQLAEELARSGKKTMFYDLDEFCEAFNPDYKWRNDEEKEIDLSGARKLLADVTNTTLEHQIDVITVGPFLYKDEIETYVKHINQNAKIYLYQLTMPIELRFQRNKARKWPSKEEDMQAEEDNLINSKVDYSLKVENIDDIPTVVKKLITRINNSQGEIKLPL